MGWVSYIRTETGKTCFFADPSFQMNFFERWNNSVSLKILGERFSAIETNRPSESCDEEYSRDPSVLKTMISEVKVAIKDSNKDVYLRHVKDIDLVLSVCDQALKKNESVVIGIYH